MQVRSYKKYVNVALYISLVVLFTGAFCLCGFNLLSTVLSCQPEHSL